MAGPDHLGSAGTLVRDGHPVGPVQGAAGRQAGPGAAVTEQPVRTESDRRLAAGRRWMIAGGVLVVADMVWNVTNLLAGWPASEWSGAIGAVGWAVGSVGFVCLILGVRDVGWVTGYSRRVIEEHEERIASLNRPVAQRRSL